MTATTRTLCPIHGFDASLSSCAHACEHTNVRFVLALAVWVCYVAIGRTFVPAIRRHPNAAYSRTVGIGLLVAFIVLFIVFMWTYLTIIFTGPGFAKDFVPESEDPSWRNTHAITPHVVHSNYTQADLRNGQQLSSPQPETVPVGHDFPTSFSGTSARFSNHGDLTSFGGRVSQEAAPYSSLRPHQHETEAAPVVLPTIPTPAFTTNPRPISAPPTTISSRIPRPTPAISVGPRWCAHCKIIKPDRTHHCRHCGSCILQFDHHCVWVGQCVGWRNHAVFITFCFWAGVFCCFSCTVLVVDSCLAPEVDGQKIALITIAGILFIFTLLMMFPTHVYLVLVGRSTIESFQTGDQQRAEEAALKLEFNNPMCPTKDVRAVRKQWKEEFGGVAVNDRWKVGRARDRWRREMGNSPLGWILPIGRPLGDGIHYEQNPRFGPNGEWLPMRQWPQEAGRL
ncbi:zf-DHHC-domain-containing protein [Cutaneotrichosporon oleaginosum]|uniref:Palmitoyltransferase n=1 Tax=Cutaneotrichosporon oleaginosum TaxID=879819 RepID=A0A0J0XR13_9TREE|nr:zf-DHHC-domain-containing protein [Cutaneotrichosporon oleaginosum]KLT43515.1 zf-DHHC-domain-containing protein [Cutaneotrichosporon oleaginosum]TXT05586.1 hypothetical protein COLE_06906 [Cutaneotrichosporon oleaginosum]